MLAWLLYKDPVVNRRELNQQLCSKRYVKKSLWKKQTIREFHEWLLQRGDAQLESHVKNILDNPDEEDESDASSF